jgi:hypothetical protein
VNRVAIVIFGGVQEVTCTERSNAMNRPLTGLVVLATSAAATAGFAGTAAADPAPPTLLNLNGPLIQHTVQQAVGKVLPLDKLPGNSRTMDSPAPRAMRGKPVAEAAPPAADFTPQLINLADQGVAPPLDLGRRVVSNSGQLLFAAAGAPSGGS